MLRFTNARNSELGNPLRTVQNSATDAWHINHRRLFPNSESKNVGVEGPTYTIRLESQALVVVLLSSDLNLQLGAPMNETTKYGLRRIDLRLN